MDNDITTIDTIDTANYDEMADVMGISAESGGSNSTRDMLCRMRIWNRPIMGTVDQSGKKRQMEVVPGGTFRFDTGTGKFTYAETVTFRPFLQRFRFNRWLPYGTPDARGKKGRYIKSVFTNDYKLFTSSDLMDEDGGFNCGRPSGYVKDWQALPENTRKLITSVKRVRAVFGTAVVKNALNELGETVETNGTPVPVIWEIENNSAFKIIGEVLKKYQTVGHLFPQHNIELSTEGEPMSNGNMLYMPVPTLNIAESIDIVQPDDSEILKAFQKWVVGYNKYIIESHNKKTPSPPFTSEEQETLESFISVDEGA